MTSNEVFLRREPAPPDSLLKGQTVLYRLDGKVYRVAELTWQRMLTEQIKEKVR